MLGRDAIFGIKVAPARCALAKLVRLRRGKPTIDAANRGVELGNVPRLNAKNVRQFANGAESRPRMTTLDVPDRFLRHARPLGQLGQAQ